MCKESRGAVRVLRLLKKGGGAKGVKERGMGWVVVPGYHRWMRGYLLRQVVGAPQFKRKDSLASRT